MKMLPVQLSLNPPLGLWSDVLWRCPPAPPSQLAELKTQLPSSLPSDPKLWGREDVSVFLRFCEREFDLPKLDHDLFQMNGKALCLLTRSDFGNRCPGAGDVLHNVLQMLIIESHMMQWHLPNSPVTPTSRYPLSPHSHPPTPTWPPIVPTESSFNGAHMHHFMAPNSVTLSPPPSVDSQASSPPQSSELSSTSNSVSTAISGSTNSCSNSSNTLATSMSFNQNNTTSNSSNQSDSDEDSYNGSAAIGGYAKSTNNTVAAAAAAVVAQYKSSPPSTPILKDLPQSISQQITNNFVTSWSQSQQQLHYANGGSVSAPTTPSYMPVKREFFPENTDIQTKTLPIKREFFTENAEPNSNGRLLWDFLQQLLNDRNQKYSDLIAWKCRDTGVFKIVDPAGLAKLWGIQKNHLSMNYDKMSRALRYYYRVNILRKVQGERHCYQFLRNPSELKNIKNISLLRQTITNNSSNGSNSSAAAAICGGSNGVTAGQQPSSPSLLSHSTNANSTNWSVNHQNHHQNMNSIAHQQQSGSTAQQSATRSTQNHLGLPPISSQAAAAAVAAAAAAGYGPPPSSPLFMHAINGAFHYLSSSSGSGQTPSSPVPPATPSEKLQFSALNMDNNADEMKPTDLSVASTIEKRPYSSASSTNEDCYPLIRNADGLTTIKLIRYNDNESVSQVQNEQVRSDSHKQDEEEGAEKQQKQQQYESPMDEQDDRDNGDHFGQPAGPTDLSK